RTGLFREPRNRLNEAAQRLDIAADNLQRATGNSLSESRQRLADFIAVLRQYRPDQLLAIRRSELEVALAKILNAAKRRIDSGRHSVQRLSDLLRLLSPEATLERGYTITTDAQGVVVKSVSELPGDGRLHTRFRDGSAESVIVRVAD
ncbi:MAG TPA: exodeoxyribonuclease VII large subunit, partial [Chthoniobacteraceae bacterium]|nr:exodeoxyribonuclease VII large subunit [Chthoniobacteraceae bacterium]